MNAVGLDKSFGSSASESSESRTQVNPNERWRPMWNLLVQEARAVSLASLLAMGFRIFLFFLITAKALLEDSSNVPNEFRARLNVAMIWKEVAAVACMMVSTIVALVPSKVLLLQAPAFLFANPWYASVWREIKWTNSFLSRSHSLWCYPPCLPYVPIGYYYGYETKRVSFPMYPFECVNTSWVESGERIY